MDRLRQLARQLAHQLAQSKPTGWRLELEADAVTVILPNDHRQRIAVERRGAHYVLSSVVIGQARVAGLGRAELLPRLWERNRVTNVVAFTLDKRGRLIGQIEQIAETLDLDELATYLHWLARECDGLEYLLTGQDKE